MNEAFLFNSCLQNSYHYRFWDFGHQVGGRSAMNEQLMLGIIPGFYRQNRKCYTLYKQEGLSLLLSLSDVIALYSVLQKVGKTVASKVIIIVV